MERITAPSGQSRLTPSILSAQRKFVWSASTPYASSNTTKYLKRDVEVSVGPRQRCKWRDDTAIASQRREAIIRKPCYIDLHVLTLRISPLHLTELLGMAFQYVELVAFFHSEKLHLCHITQTLSSHFKKTSNCDRVQRGLASRTRTVKTNADNSKNSLFRCKSPAVSFG